MKKFISVMLSLTAVTSLTSLQTTATDEDYGYPLGCFEVIDTCGYFDENPYFPNCTILKWKEYETYAIVSEYDDGIGFNGASLDFLCYSLETDEEYNTMSEYLSENYPEFSLKYISGDAEEYLKYMPGNYIIETGKDMSEKEIFEFATKIKNDTGYYFEIRINQDMPSKLDCRGDANSDYSVNISDAVAVTAYVSSKEKNPLAEQSALNGDVFNTGDGLNASDAFKIQQYATGQIDTL